ncbi:hypothetical protein PMI05_00825 [Brevibacillus sp. BC25]|nr:hypothetical protein PMI05_00825 [Brevibacillus sp. BC25]
MSALVFQGNGCIQLHRCTHSLLVPNRFFFVLRMLKSGLFSKKNINTSQREGSLRFFIENGRKILLHTK